MMPVPFFSVCISVSLHKNSINGLHRNGDCLVADSHKTRKVKKTDADKVKREKCCPVHKDIIFNGMIYKCFMHKDLSYFDNSPEETNAASNLCIVQLSKEAESKSVVAVNAGTLTESISDETATDEHKRTSTEGIAATSFPEMTLAEYKYMRDDLREALYKELEVEARKELTAHFASNGFAGSSAFQAFINSKAEHEHQVLWNGVRQRVKNGRKRADSNELHQRTWDVEEVRKRAFKDGQNDAYNNFTNKVLICLILTFFATACFVLFIYTLANLSVAVYHGTSLIEKLFKKFLVKFLMKFLAWWGKLIMGRTSILALFT